MNNNLYEVRGVFSQTKRKRRTIIHAKSSRQATLKATEQGFIEPIEIVEIPHESPTERQITYAIDLGIHIPQDASKEDVSALLSRKLDYDSEPNPGLLEFADERGLFFSKYIGKKILYNKIFRELDIRDRIAFFAFSIYRYLSDDRHANLDTSPFNDKFYLFADQVVTEESFIKSLNRYEGKDLRYFGKAQILEDGYIIETYGGSVNTIAYKKTVKFLNEEFILPETRTRTFGSKREHANNTVETETVSSIQSVNDIENKNSNLFIRTINGLVTIIGSILGIIFGFIWIIIKIILKIK
jgi:hypothetical protein